MAVTTTVTDILVAALARSQKNRPNAIATNASELLEVVFRAMRALYALAAEVNPTFFADSDDVAYAAPGWARPPEAENVFRIELDGTEVAVVPYDDLGAETGMPAVYALGQIYRSAGNADDPTAADTLRIFFSRLPEKPTSVSDTLDAQWPEQFNELLNLEVAIYLALKDGRMDEVQILRPARDGWATLYGKFLEHETSNLRRRFGHAKKFNSNMIEKFLA